ncbi:MAG: leucine-rich repeat protein, partial [Paludibacteraceae bacterium]|nr:leucine-rich repeat protein [Paludibacteraceae bacterium]
AFAGCKRLVTIMLPERLTAIGANAFKHCIALKVIDIPSTVKFIGDEAFAECKSLTAILFITKTPPSLGTDVFRDAAVHGNYQYINVPCGALSAYKSNWPTYQGAIRERCM